MFESLFYLSPIYSESGRLQNLYSAILQKHKSVFYSIEKGGTINEWRPRNEGNQSRF